jgi:hypothetical protein
MVLVDKRRRFLAVEIGHVRYLAPLFEQQRGARD